MKTPPKQPVAKGGVPLPPGAKNVPGTAAYRQLQGAPRPKPVQIDERFVAGVRGGPELKVGKSHVVVKDNRSGPRR